MQPTGNRTLVVIPARYSSTRLPAKVLLKARDLRGESLLEAIVDALASEGIRILETPPFLGPLLVQAGRLTGREPTAREQRLSEALHRAKEVIVEITSENLDLKKTFLD